MKTVTGIGSNRHHTDNRQANIEPRGRCDRYLGEFFIRIGQPFAGVGHGRPKLRHEQSDALRTVFIGIG